MNWPAFATIAAALVAGFSAWYVQAWRLRREAGDQATQILRQHRDPLLRAAFDLQSRLYNIVAGYFLRQYWLNGNDAEKAYALNSTLWLIGQYLGRVEILRREVQYLDLGSRTVNQVLQQRLSSISSALASDASWLGDPFITFRSDQRAIGEFMVIERASDGGGERADCLGYLEFVERLGRVLGSFPDESASSYVHTGRRRIRSQTRQAETTVNVTLSPFVAWATRFKKELEEAAKDPRGNVSQPRLITTQRRLIDLVDLLDPDRVRYPGVDGRGKLPAPAEVPSASAERIASFVWPFSDPWSEVEKWAGSRYECESRTSDTRTYVARQASGRGRVKFRIRYGYRVEIDAWSSTGGRQKKIDGSLRSRRAREVANELLKRFDRPLIAGGATVPDRFVTRLLSETRRADAEMPRDGS